MHNKITDEQISKSIKSKGIVENVLYMDFDDACRVVQEHFDFKITKDFYEGEFKFYEETTADGYTVYIASCSGIGYINPSISQDLYYYETDWLDTLPEAMRSASTIYLEDGITDGYPYEDVIRDMYDGYISDKIAEVEQELIEQGYEQA